MFSNFGPGRRPALHLTVPNGTVNCATMTLLALFFVAFKKG